MKRIFKNVFLLSLVPFLTGLLSSCGNSEDDILFDRNKNGDLVFTPDSNSNVQLFFFDSDNFATDNTGESYERTFYHKTSVESTKSITASESYMIKSGNVEILVDCGFQSRKSSIQEDDEYKYFDINVINNCNKNLLKKIKSICSDGVLDYLIVTHGDFDHIASLSVENGIVDAFLRNDTTEDCDYGAFKSIKNVIDFNSGFVALHSYSEIDEDQRLCKGLYQTYLVKMHKLVASGTNYLPAAALFSESVKTDSGETMSFENKGLATPKKMMNYFFNNFETTILSESKPNTSASQYVNSTPKNTSYIENVNALNGKLKKQNDRFYYSIQLGQNTELRFLYNWYYDFAYRQSFNGDGQPQNNISVCFGVVSNNFKYLGLGDLGGNGEDGLLQYYGNTDILSNITVQKASHHGSTGSSSSDEQRENSIDLFKKTTPKIVVVVGCAQSLLGIVDNTSFVKQKFINNLKEATNGDLPYILYTNICTYKNVNNVPYYFSGPFYGDISIRNIENKTFFSTSYCGTIHAYIQSAHENDILDFKTRNEDGNILKLHETAWFSASGFVL